MIRLYTPYIAKLSQGLKLALSPDQGRYVAAVMRRTVGDELALFNGIDGEWRVSLIDISKKVVLIEVLDQLKPQTDNSGPILVMALVKRARLETIIEKATELGVSRIQLVITRRTNGDHTNVERLQLIANEAAEQTERLDVPSVHPPLKLDKFIKDFDDGFLIFADEDSTHEATPCLPMLEAIKDKTGQAYIVIGPEGGFDETERVALNALPQVVRVSLGPRILRADTAAQAALVLYQARLGDWKK